MKKKKQQPAAPGLSAWAAVIREIGIKHAVQCPKRLSPTFFESIPNLSGFRVECHSWDKEHGIISYGSLLYLENGQQIGVSPDDWVVTLNTGLTLMLRPAEYECVTNQTNESTPKGL